MPSSLLFCLGGHRVFKSMQPTKFLGCNSWTLPFPIPAGGEGPTGIQNALNGRSLPQWLPPRAQLGNTPTHCCHDLPPSLAPAGFVRPWRALGAFPATVATTESTTGTPTRAPTRHDPRPLPPRVRPTPGALRVLSPSSPWASGEPRPHARFQERFSDLFHLLLPDET